MRLALASVALGAVGVVFAVSTWVTWLIIQPGDPTPLTIVVALVLGALWVVVLGAAVLALIFGFVGRAAGGLAKAGIGLGVVAMLLALGGAVAFVAAAADWTPVVAR
ncbi:hypothetical protein LWP59_09575 [Amycolatopsis acidiphila]|uniref:Major facilitator superfamily (MFS) profile domain-containing protein n=1 Tax=Amycolatopsis acidiphila TaxID=715473 RepID=A0A558A5U3_9PSEU|nr:hypothetical protein [Amycolatopsis acidiphila]TVT19639.1 hypothetical protein FNH06_23285 [Amycolatopsis acidiphila]UIJ61843.1 hypothetical protein LWP59_09575 [Amycolatopsis acidiphila]GHG57620.1 hypothetical protein GCM10017788_09350 [Amycolatopsis acidiphila]